MWSILGVIVHHIKRKINKFDVNQSLGVGPLIYERNRIRTNYLRPKFPWLYCNKNM